MSLWSRFFGGSTYKDDAIMDAIHTALLDDPLILDPTSLHVVSKEGVVTLEGSVDKSVVKDHVEGAVRETLRYKDLKFASIVNNIKVKSAVALD